MRRPQDETVQVAPRRLVEGTDRTAALLWRAQKAPPPGTPKDFASLLAKQEAHVRRMRIGVALVAACLPLGAVLWSERPKTELLIAPERLGALAEATDVTSGPPEESAPAQAGSARSTAEEIAENESATKATDRDVASAEGPRSGEAKSPTAASDSPSATNEPLRPGAPQRPTHREADGRANSLPGPVGHPRSGTPSAEERCSTWTSRGDYGAAADCYGRKARGTGVSAEWALLEKARIHSRAQGKPGEALLALDEYEDRFPDGSLAREARLSRIEILTSAGRTEDALRALDETLRDDQIPERTGELLLLRAQLRADSSSCTGALQDMEAALNRGIAPARARSIQEKCPR